VDCLNGVDDHIHLLIRLRTDQTVADVVKIIKGNSWEFFKEDTENYVTWQDGYAVFSVSPANLKAVRNYIYRQEIHHKDKGFVDEMKEIKIGVRANQ
jgi:putative transposase